MWDLDHSEVPTHVIVFVIDRIIQPVRSYIALYNVSISKSLFTVIVDISFSLFTDNYDINTQIFTESVIITEDKKYLPRSSLLFDCKIAKGVICQKRRSSSIPERQQGNDRRQLQMLLPIEWRLRCDVVHVPSLRMVDKRQNRFESSTVLLGSVVDNFVLISLGPYN